MPGLLSCHCHLLAALHQCLYQDSYLFQMQASAYTKGSQEQQ